MVVASRETTATAVSEESIELTLNAIQMMNDVQMERCADGERVHWGRVESTGDHETYILLAPIGEAVVLLTSYKKLVPCSVNRRHMKHSRIVSGLDEKREKFRKPEEI
jgi:hypothetical protein